MSELVECLLFIFTNSVICLLSADTHLATRCHCYTRKKLNKLILKAQT